MDWALGAGVGFSRIVSLGNQVDVGASDMIEAIGRDGHTRVVTAYLEGIRNGRKFVEAASKAAKDFPIAVLKAGRSTSAARAAASHTGALAGDVEAYRAAFRRAGVLWAETTEELFDWGRALAWQPLPKGNRVAILTNAGGPAILAVDALVEAGMQLAPLSASTKSFLRQRVLPAASVENPVDILAGSGPATYALCLDALLTDETVDAVVVMQAPQDWFDPISVAEVVGEVANSALGRQKPIIAVLMGLASTSEATQALHRRRIPNFAFAERVGSTLAAMWWRKQWLDAQVQPQRPARFTKVDRDTAKAAIRAGLEVNRIVIGKQAGSARSGWMTAEQVTALLNAYKIETPTSGLAPNVKQAIPLAESVGYPVALKLAATDVTHKTDLGGVVLDVETPDELREAFEAMIARVVERAPKANIQGAYVQHMVKGQVELIVGVVRDPQFGPLVMAGSGGTHVELTRDVTFELAPLSARQADEMLDRTAAGKLLVGYRGAPPADRKAVVDVILRLAQIAVDWPEISEIEINPLIVMAKGGGASAVDARVRLAYIADDEDGSAAG
jgi:acetyltransferase